eukprot:1141768-Pelagomonas_calceolata.AAC.2
MADLTHLWLKGLKFFMGGLKWPREHKLKARGTLLQGAARGLFSGLQESAGSVPERSHCDFQRKREPNNGGVPERSDCDFQRKRVLKNGGVPERSHCDFQCKRVLDNGRALRKVLTLHAHGAGLPDVTDIHESANEICSHVHFKTKPISHSLAAWTGVLLPHLQWQKQVGELGD